MKITDFPYDPIHFRSHFSLLRGILSPEEICRYALSSGYKAVGLMDINNFYGLIRFIKSARFQGLKPLAGIVLSDAKKPLLSIYVMNAKGFNRVCGIITRQLYELSPYIKPSAKKNYDPIQDLVCRGWEGLCLVSEDTDQLERLMQNSKKGLYVKLTYGKNFSSLVRWARRAGLPLLAVNDAVFLEETDRRLYNILRAMDLNTTLGKIPSAERIQPFCRTASGREMNQYFEAVPDSLKNNQKLVNESRIEEIIPESYIFPAFSGLPDDESFRLLEKLCLEGVGVRYVALTRQIEDRLHYELSIIREKNFSGYFLVVHDIVNQCPRTCGRGSSASSIVSYLLGITHVDPLKYNLFFERFLNRGRKDPPDIDVDFPWDERKKVLEYVFKKYRGHTGMVANHITFGHRSALRRPAKALGIPEEEITRIIKSARLRRFQEVPNYLVRISERIKGFPHYIGPHCGGVIITPGPITRYTHLQLSLTGYPVIAWEKDATEEAGLVKIDLLGNRSLSVLRDTINLVNESHKAGLDWKSFSPVNEPGTREMIRKGDTLGIFYVESPATRQLLKKMRTGDYENLVIASSIIRPAANAYIREFVKRLHNGSYTPLHPLIAETLKETFGILVYQEDVSRVAMDLSGFSIEDADDLRKIISKKDRENRIENYRQKFIQGGLGRQVDKKVLNEIWAMILSFKGYSFCKAHSASYALVSYKLAYLKHYYPLEFMASVINNRGGFYSRQTYINEVRRLGFSIAGPDVNKSGYRYTVDGDTLNVGLSQLSDVSHTFLNGIIEKRKKKPFKGLQDFLNRVKPGLPEMRILIRSGSLDSLSEGLSRPQLFWRFFTCNRPDEFFLLPPAPPFIGDYPDRIKIRDEAETLGLIISRHPLQIFRPRLVSMVRKLGIPSLISSRDIPKNRNKHVSLAGLIVTGKEVTTKTREAMVFVSFEDPYSIFETVFFPESFKKFHSLLDQSGVYILSGKVEEEQGAISINVENLVKASR
ncbi:MAG: DNA polymerase III subunit alpha [Spirochaetales bacterium]|nr:DNA polymerase III subunit alpha [Spirochaetales bacterium]